MQLQLVRADALSRLPWLLHGFSTRGGGASESYGGAALNLGYTKHDTHAAVDQNRVTLLKALGAVNSHGETWPLVRLRQVHSDTVHRIAGWEGIVCAATALYTAWALVIDELWERPVLPLGPVG